MSDTFDHELDAFERMMDGEIDEEPRIIRCNRCLIKAFTWGQTPKGWRLHNKKGEVHYCLSMETSKVLK